MGAGDQHVDQVTSFFLFTHLVYREEKQLKQQNMLRDSVVISDFFFLLGFYPTKKVLVPW